MAVTPQQPPSDVVARYLWSLWRQGRRPDIHAFVRKAGDLPPTQLLAVLRVDQHEQWRAGERRNAESYLDAYPKLLDCPETCRLIYDEILLRQEKGELVELDDYYRRFPQFAEFLWEQFQQQRPPTSEESLRWLASRNNWQHESPAETKLEQAPIAEAPLSIPPPAPEEPPGRQATEQVKPKIQRVVKDSAGPAAWPNVPGYTLLAELGRGGMGVVYKARHDELHRFVALKMIRANVLVDETDMGRFRAEGKVLAKLQHPNIVQIFEVGEYEGDPYFAVEFVDGGDLAGKLRVQLPQPRRAANIIQMLADAIHYAHQQGIIHRDLKPANILLAVDGTPKIADFGLAKRLDASKRRTASGAIFGTPYYMAPEQAEGLTHEVGPTADIYALGAMLYELLTGRPPFRAATVLETLELVRLTDPVPPRKMQPGVPRDLETICLKCLEKSPARRYASGKSLSADLDRFLHGETILARPVGRLEQGWRWMRRHRAVTALLLLLVISIVAGFAAVTRQWLLTRQERAQAVVNFQLARDAVDRYLTKVSEDPRLKARDAEPLRKELLSSAKEFYAQLAERYGNDPSLRVDLARANARLAWLTALTASTADAARYYQEAEQLLTPLVDDGSDSTDARRDLARIYLSEGELYYDLGRMPEAETAIQNAVVQRQRLAQENSQAVGDQLELAAAIAAQAMLQLASGRAAQAEAGSRDAIRLIDQLGSRVPPREDYQALRANCYRGLGTALATQRRSAEAQTYLQQALDQFERLGTPGSPTHPYANEIALTSIAMAGALREAGDNARSEEWLRRALQIAGPLAQAHPTVLEYQYTLVSLQLARAASLEALHQNTEVEKVFGEINAVMEKLIRQQGANVRCLFVQADVHGMQAAFYLSLGNVASAGNHFQLALAAWEKLVQASFPNAQFLFGAAKSSMDFGGFCAEKTRQPEKAEAAFRRSNELMEAAVKVEPGNWELKAFWSASLLRSGLFLVSAGKAKEAAAPTEKAVALLGELRLERPNEISLLQSQAIAYAVWRKVCQANQRPDDAKVAEQNAIATLNLWIKGLKDTVSTPEDAWPQDFKETMAGAYAFRAAQLESLDRAGEAIADWDRAMRLGPEGERGKFRRSRAAALTAAGKHREAAGELEALEKADRATGEDWYQLAIGYARAFDAAGRDSTLSKEEQDKTKNNYGSHAVNALARARKEGLFKVPQQVERVKADATFAGLKSRGDFRKLVDEIGEASK